MSSSSGNVQGRPASRRGLLKPPLVEGVAEATARDHLQALLWLLRHHTTVWQAERNRFSGVLMVMWWIALPVTVPFTASRPWRRHVRYYATEHAHLGVRVQRNGDWYLQDHIASERGHGYGRALRAPVLEALLPLVDASGITLNTDTRSEEMAHRYVAELPGAVATRRGLLWVITRRPQVGDDSSITD